MGFSAGPVVVSVLLESLLPRLFGGPFWYVELESWAHSSFPWGTPYFLSVYLGAGVLALQVL